MRDFTHKIYRDFLTALKKRNFQFITVEEYFNSEYNEDKPFIIIRHDVDRRPKSSLKMAKIENSMGIKATYYFRTISQTFKPDIIREIANLKHEIGYHYESLAETNGNYEKAIEDFAKNLYRLREIYPVKSISMHGRPTSKWDSRLLWKRYNYRDYGVLSEPYLDIDFKEVLYITDAGREWNNELINRRDRVDSSFNFRFNHTEEIISNINRGVLPNKIMVNIHPEHWAEGNIEWYRVLFIRKIKNFVKKQFLS